MPRSRSWASLLDTAGVDERSVLPAASARELGVRRLTGRVPYTPNDAEPNSRIPRDPNELLAAAEASRSKASSTRFRNVILMMGAHAGGQPEVSRRSPTSSTTLRELSVCST